MKYNFQEYYWGNDQHTSVKFHIFDNIPKGVTPTASMVVVNDSDSILMVKLKRGWGLPSGHIELNERPEDCAKREVYEEANVIIQELELLGGWITKKILQNEDNKKYPINGVMLLYIAKVKTIDNFLADFETSDRKFVKINDITKIHDGRSDFYEIIRYLINEKLN